MPFKVIQEVNGEPQYGPYIQKKMEIARKFGTVYELVNEDERINLLETNPNLESRRVIRGLDRVRLTNDGKEYLVARIEVVFYDKNTGVEVDKYSDAEGIQVEPVKQRNEAGIVTSNSTITRYLEEFSPSKVDQYLNEADGLVPLRFFETSMNTTRLPRGKTIVGNEEMFKEATWDELLIAREQKLVSSIVNPLEQVREVKGAKGNLLKAKTTQHNQQQAAKQQVKEESAAEEAQDLRKVDVEATTSANSEGNEKVQRIGEEKTTTTATSSKKTATNSGK
jgi:hypothetical protein